MMNVHFSINIIFFLFIYECIMIKSKISFRDSYDFYEISLKNSNISKLNTNVYVYLFFKWKNSLGLLYWKLEVASWNFGSKQEISSIRVCQFKFSSQRKHFFVNKNNSHQ